MGCPRIQLPAVQGWRPIIWSAIALSCSLGPRIPLLPPQVLVGGSPGGLDAAIDSLKKERKRHLTLCVPHDGWA